MMNGRAARATENKTEMTDRRGEFGEKQGSPEVITAQTAGFCFGVERAVNMVYEQLASGRKPLYTYGPIIHNEAVVGELEDQGVRILHNMQELEEAEPGTIIIRSHGTTRAEQERMEELGYTVADATCPFVKKIHRLVQENAHKRFNCLIVGLKGQAARATRRFLKRLNEEKGLPVYICNDGDPWGFHIAQVIISGSAKLAHVNHDLATPDAKFIGVTASDIINYDLPTDKLKDVDVLRLKELSKDPRYKSDFWQTEIKKMLKIGKKAEQQSFSKYGLEYVVDEYFPAKFEEMENQA